MSLMRTKSIERSIADTEEPEFRLRKSLSALDLTVFGVGVVIGATHEHGLDLSALGGAVLAPGLGAQGASPADVAARFAGLSGIVVPTASRSVLRAGPDPAALRGAAEALRDELEAARTAS